MFTTTFDSAATATGSVITAILGAKDDRTFSFRQPIVRTVPPGIQVNEMYLNLLGLMVWGKKCIVAYGDECGSPAGEGGTKKAKRKKTKRKLEEAEVDTEATPAATTRGVGARDTVVADRRLEETNGDAMLDICLYGTGILFTKSVVFFTHTQIIMAGPVPVTFFAEVGRGWGWGVNGACARCCSLGCSSWPRL